MVLNAIGHILEVGESEMEENKLATQFEKIGGVRKLEGLQHHENIKMYTIVVEIMAKYYDMQEADLCKKADVFTEK